jgi:hypothetical protein
VIRLPADTVAQIAEVLRASADELLGLRGLQASARHAAGSIKSRRLYRRMQEIEKLPRRDQEVRLRTHRGVYLQDQLRSPRERTP